MATGRDLAIAIQTGTAVEVAIGAAEALIEAGTIMAMTLAGWITSFLKSFMPRQDSITTMVQTTTNLTTPPSKFLSQLGTNRLTIQLSLLKDQSLLSFQT